MHRRPLSSLLVIGALGLVGCGSSPASLSPTPSSGFALDAAAETAVNAMVAQALSQTTASGLTLASSLPVAPVHSFPCPGGGNVTMTMSMPALTAGMTEGPFTITSRIEYNDCRSQNVTMRGAPALMHSSEFSRSGPTSGAPTALTATMRTTGGLTIVSNGVETLMRVDCTSVMVAGLGQFGSTPVPEITWTGTRIWESPVGTVVRTTECGPAR